MRLSYAAPLVLVLGSLLGCGQGTIDSEPTSEAASASGLAWTVISGTTDVTPTPAVLNGKLYLFARGIGDSAVYFRSSTNGTTWSGWSSLPGITTDAAITPVEFGNSLFVFARKPSDNKIYVNTSSNGTTWSGWSVIGAGGTTNTAVAAAVFGGKLFVFSKGIGDNTIYSTSSTNGTSWSSWSAITGTTNVAPSVVVFGNKMILWTRALSDGKIYFRTTTSGTSWSSWTAFDGTTGGSPEIGTVTKDTTATGVRAAVFSGDLWVMNVDPDDHRVYASMTRDLSIWSGWFELPPRSQTTSAAASVVAFGGTLHWFATGYGNNYIWQQTMPIYKLPFSAGGGWNGGSNMDDTGGVHGPGQAYAYDMGRDNGAPGDAVRAMRGGWVTGFHKLSNCNTSTSTSCDGAGNWVHIVHDDGTDAAYLHMLYNTVTVTLNQRVEQGDVLGQLGNTGESSGPHVHVDLRQYWVSPGNMGPTIPFYFEDTEQPVPWRPRHGNALSSTQSPL